MVSWAGDDDTAQRPLRDPVVLECVECGARTTSARGWSAVRIDLPDESGEPALAFYCPDCAGRELGA